MTPKTLSAQMQAVLQLLDSESLTARQLNNRLYDMTSSQSRRVFAASMSRTLRRMEQRGLISCEDGTISIRSHGWYTLHPEKLQTMLEEISTGIRESVRKAVAESLTMPEYHWLNPSETTEPPRNPIDDQTHPDHARHSEM
jgi:hypothetical protein